MKPTQINPGKKLLISIPYTNSKRIAYFVKRIPAQPGGQAINLVRFPAFEGLNGYNDDGTCQMSDQELAKCGEYAL